MLAITGSQEQCAEGALLLAVRVDGAVSSVFRTVIQL
jgi:hypothetical protein